MTGFDPISVELAKIIIKTLWESGGNFLGWMDGSLSERKKQRIYRASQQYIQKYTARRGILNVLGMRQPIALELVYTEVQVLDEQDIRWFESIASLEEAYRQTRKGSYQPKDSSKQEGLKLANEKQYLMVLGGSGAGKTTFLRRIGLEALKGKEGGFKQACFPVFIELNQFKVGEINMEEVIAKEFRICDFPSPEESTKKLLQQGKLLILLDGLDELPIKNLNEAIIQIQNFVDQYDKNRFIASCRTAAYRSSFRRFTNVVLADFDAQIEQFICNWFHSEAAEGVTRRFESVAGQGVQVLW